MVSQVTRGAVNPANAGYSAEGAIAALVGELQTLGETNVRITSELDTAKNKIAALKADFSRPYLFCIPILIIPRAWTLALSADHCTPRIASGLVQLHWKS